MHKLTASESIVIDGHADDGAWGEVAWSEAFQDIEGDLLKPRPRFETKVSAPTDCRALLDHLKESSHSHLQGSYTVLHTSYRLPGSLPEHHLATCTAYSVSVSPACTGQDAI